MGYSVSVSGRVQLEAGWEPDAVESLRSLVWRGEDLDGPGLDLSDLVVMVGCRSNWMH